MPNGNYEDAPATKLVATHCCCCGRALLDAESVEIGIGPVCREKYGYVGGSVSPEVRDEANKLVYQIACNPKADSVVAALLRLRELGFVKLADRIADVSKAACYLERSNVVDDEVWFFSDKDERIISTIKTVSSWANGRRRWDPINRCWVLDLVAARAVLPALTQLGIYVASSPEVEALLAQAATPKPEQVGGGNGFGEGGGGRGGGFVSSLPKPQVNYRFTVAGDKVTITTPYNPDAVTALKGAATGYRKFDGSTKSWIIELAVAAKVAEALRPFFPGLTDEMLADERIASAKPKARWSVIGDVVSIATPYKAEVVAAIKSAAQGACRFDGDDKAWHVELSVAAQVAAALRPFHPELADEMLADVRIAGEAKARAERVQLSTAAEIQDGGPGAEIAARLKARLPEGCVPYPYQIVGATFFEAAKGRALNADVMGLGKTIQALLWLSLHWGLQRVLIVVPASLTINWLREVQKWVPQCEVSITKNGKDKIPDVRPQATDSPTRVVITSYECATRRKAEWMAWAPEALILDECHYLKNTTAQRTKAIVGVEARKDKITGEMKPAVDGIATHVQYILALSGTPMLNRPIELYTTLHMITPTTFASFFGFAKRYAGAEQTRFGWDFTGATNVEELRARLSNIMIRREKSQVLAELPPKRRAQITVQLSNVDEYEEYEEDAKDRFTNKERKGERFKGDVLVALGKLRMLAGLGKVDAAVEWLTNADMPVVVFCHHKEVLDAIGEGLTKAEISWVKVTGDMDVEDRQAAVDSFQAGESRVFLGTYGAAGVGLTLTAASDTLHVERAWTPAAEEQAEDRCHRIGQTESVTSWYMMSDVSIDAKFHSLVEAKRATISSVMDAVGLLGIEGGGNESLTGELACEIFGKDVWS